MLSSRSRVHVHGQDLLASPKLPPGPQITTTASPDVLLHLSLYPIIDYTQGGRAGGRVSFRHNAAQLRVTRKKIEDRTEEGSKHNSGLLVSCWSSGLVPSYLTLISAQVFVSHRIQSSRRMCQSSPALSVPGVASAVVLALWRHLFSALHETGTNSRGFEILASLSAEWIFQQIFCFPTEFTPSRGAGAAASHSSIPLTPW